MNNTPFETAYEELKALGLVLQKAPGQYRVNFRHGTKVTEFLTDDLEAALQQRREMAKHPTPPSEPPLGPMRPRSLRRAFMYSHNNRVAARRRKRKGQG
jgi:hypothetical protein